MLTFDYVLSNRIGFGAYQYWSFAILGFIDFLDGTEGMYVTLLNAILVKEWNLTLFQLILLGAIFNAGLFIGAIICSLFADHFGRKNLLVFASALQFLAVLATIFAENINHMYILRFFYGLVMGLSLPISVILITEVTPLQYRGRMVTFLQIMYILGHLWIIFLGGIFLDSISGGNWRAIAALNSIPCLLCFLGTLIYIKESARFYICIGEIKRGIDCINHMGFANLSTFEKLTEEEVDQLTIWRQKEFEKAMEKKSFWGLFNSQNLPITWRVWTIAALFFFVFAGLYLIIPFILDKESKGLLDLFWTIASEVPAVFLVFFLIDQPRWGRIKIVMIGLCMSGICLIVIWYFEERFLVLALSFFNFFARIIFLAFTPLVTESYSTVYRSLGIGFSICIGRISGALSPLIIFPIYYSNAYEPFFIAMVIITIIFCVILTYPSDLTQKPLDLNLDEERKKSN